MKREKQENNQQKRVNYSENRTVKKASQWKAKVKNKGRMMEKRAIKRQEKL